MPQTNEKNPKGKLKQQKKKKKIPQKTNSHKTVAEQTKR